MFSSVNVRILVLGMFSGDVLGRLMCMLLFDRFVVVFSKGVLVVGLRVF